MGVNIKEKLEAYVKNSRAEMKHSREFSVSFPDIELDPGRVKVVMINEVVPKNPADDFYSDAKNPDYLSTALPLFRKAGFEAVEMSDVLNEGIYITNAVKVPKREYAIPKEIIEESACILEYELSLFENIEVVMLMGDVAKKAFNMIAKRQTGKNAIPTGSTYKQRKNEFFYKDMRIMPSYIITGGNILIEKSKVDMIVEDIEVMLDMIRGEFQ